MNAAAWKQFLSLCFGKPELIRDLPLNIADPSLSVCGMAKYGKHQGLIIGYRHIRLMHARHLGRNQFPLKDWASGP
jgi:hypothetical protein